MPKCPLPSMPECPLPSMPEQRRPQLHRSESLEFRLNHPNCVKCSLKHDVLAELERI
jgi:hypothetical protein